MLFTRDEFESLAKRARKNILASEILDEIAKRGLVKQALMNGDDSSKAIRHKKWQKWQELVEGKPLSVSLFAKQGVLYYSYSYPYAVGEKNKRVETSTGIRVDPETKFRRRRILLPVRLRGLDSLLNIKNPSVAAAKLTKMIEDSGNQLLIPEACDPVALMEILNRVPLHHAKRLKADLEKAIEDREPSSRLRAMKLRLLRYSPSEFLAFENAHRLRSGSPSITSLAGLGSMLRAESNIGSAGRKQNANTSLLQKG